MNKNNISLLLLIILSLTELGKSSLELMTLNTNKEYQITPLCIACLRRTKLFHESTLNKLSNSKTVTIKQINRLMLPESLRAFINQESHLRLLANSYGASKAYNCLSFNYNYQIENEIDSLMNKSDFRCTIQIRKLYKENNKAQWRINACIMYNNNNKKCFDFWKTYSNYMNKLCIFLGQ